MTKSLKQTKPQSNMNEHVVSFFDSVISKQKAADIPIENLLIDIRNGKWAKQILQIRSAADKKERDSLKRKLPASTISCTTSGSHKASDVLCHSGLIQVDIDDIDTNEVNPLKIALSKDPLIHSCFLSPSNKLKGTIKIIPDIKLQALQAESIAMYFQEKYKRNIDLSCKDITRLMFVSYDQELYFNPNSLIFDRIESHSSIKRIYNQQQLDAIDIIEEIEKKGIDITQPYSDWVKIIYSLIDIFGFECKEYVHRVSSYHHGYSYLDTENQIEACLKSKGDGITGKTFFHFAKQNGFSIKQVKQANKEVGQISQITRIKDYIASKYEVRFNTVSLEVEYRAKDASGKFKLLNENSLFIELLEKGFSLSINTLCALLKSDFIISYDPFEEYFMNLGAWDGTDYIENLANHIKSKDKKAFNNHFKKWLVRVVACALLPDFYNKQALILIGEKQNSGKSTFCRFLCPPSLAKYIAENITTDKDSRILLAKNILINLDELAMMGKSDLNSLKAYFSKTMINERLPWGRNATIIVRRCSFIGSTNQSEFLSDETGSVRWLCFEIDSIDWGYKINIDIDKVYVQAYYLFKSGTFNYNLTGEEIRENEKRNKEFQVLTIERELLEKYLDNGMIGKDFMTPTDIMQIINSATGNQFRINHVQIGKALIMLGYKRIKHKGVYGYNLSHKNQ